jgi:hypothetical protein
MEIIYVALMHNFFFASLTFAGMLPSMAHLMNDHHSRANIYFINHPVISHSNSIELLCSSKFTMLRGKCIIRKGFNSSDNLSDSLAINVA